MRLKQMLSLLGAVALLSAAPVFSAAARGASPELARKRQGSAADGQTSANPQKQGKRNAKKVSSKRSKRRRGARGQKAPTRERIEQIQTALAREGFYEAEPTGKWDATTTEAMKRFQAAHGLNRTGKLNALSLQKLGLGSEVAGRAAPRPPAPSLPATVVKPH